MAELSQAQNLVLGIIEAAGSPGIQYALTQIRTYFSLFNEPHFVFKNSWMHILDQVRDETDSISKSGVRDILKTLVECDMVCTGIVLNSQVKPIIL